MYPPTTDYMLAQFSSRDVLSKQVFEKMVSVKFKLQMEIIGSTQHLDSSPAVVSWLF